MWFLSINAKFTDKPYCFGFPAFIEVMLGRNTLYYWKDVDIIGACINYFWTEYCICTMYIFIISVQHYNLSSHYTSTGNCINNWKLCSKLDLESFVHNFWGCWTCRSGEPKYETNLHAHMSSYSLRTIVKN